MKKLVKLDERLLKPALALFSPKSLALTRAIVKIVTLILFFQIELHFTAHLIFYLVLKIFWQENMGKFTRPTFLVKK